MPLDVLSMLWVYAMQNKVSDINIQAHDTLKTFLYALNKLYIIKRYWYCYQRYWSVCKMHSNGGLWSLKLLI